jgi:uncharacterized short protein YbdD (DUF466 family)
MPSVHGLRRFFTQTANLMVGIPDYEAYVEHRLSTHPEEPFMTQEEFFRNRQDSRYGVADGRMSRCC